MSAAAPWLVLIPLVGASLAILAGRRAAPWLTVLSGVATLGAAVRLTREVWEHGPLRYAVGGWGAPLGIDLYADGLSIAMLLTTAQIGGAIAIYALGYFPSHPAPGGGRKGESFWPLFLLLWAALNAIFLSADAFNLYVGLELMTLTAVAQVVLGDEHGALEAGMRYLLAALLGSLAYLLGVALLYASHHTLDLALLAERALAGHASWTAVALITVGLALKAALFPLHFWLPGAHSTAPAPSSAALSALVVTAAYYVLLRFWSAVSREAISYPAAQMLGALGSAAIIWGSLHAIRQQRHKIMIAYSTVAQVGYLFLLFPLIAAPVPTADPPPPWAAYAWDGAIYHAVSHALAKAAMFLAAGSIIKALGHDRIVGISGIASHLPVTTAAFGIAGISLIGIPPTGGFVAKWLLLLAAIGGAQWWWTLVLLLGGVLSAGYVFQMLNQELSQARNDHEPTFAPVPRVMQYPAMGLALAALLLGLYASGPLELLQVGSPFSPSLAGEGSP